MSDIALVVLAIVAVNPWQLRIRLGAGVSTVRAGVLLGAVGGATVAAMGLAVLGGRLPDLLDTAPATIEIGVGLVVGLVGAASLIAPGHRREALTGERQDSLIPLVYPLMLGPGPIAVWVTIGSDRGLAFAALLAGFVHGAAAILAGRRVRRASVWDGTARLAGCIAVVLAVALVIAGVREV